MPPLTLRIRNFRALREVDWTIDGVCVLAGANGAGKSSALGALRFLRNTAVRGTNEAARFADAGSAFRYLGSAPDDDVVFEITSGEWRWRLGIPVEGQGVHAYNAETLWRGDEVVLDVPRLQAGYALGADGSQRARTGAEIATPNTVRPDPDLNEFLTVLRAQTL